jgi:hypothetical protein
MTVFLVVSKENSNLQFNSQALNYVIRKEIILLENKSLVMMWKLRIGPQ